MERFFLTAMILSIAGLAFGQDEPAPDPGAAIDWMVYAAIALNSLLIPLAADLLKNFVRPILPGWLMTFLPLVLGSLIAIGEMQLLELTGIAVDLSAIEQALLGGAGGMAASVAFKFGESHGRKG